MDLTEKIESLVSDRVSFDETVYIPLEEAVEELKRRWADPELEKKVSEYLGGDIPGSFIDGFKLVMFRHICSPNFELHRLISAADAYGWKPVFGEYLEDKFTPNNLNKYYLGRVEFHFGSGRNGGEKVKYLNVIDFNESNGKPISSVKTLWGQTLAEFHRELFLERYPQFKDQDVFFDSSEWFKKNGGSAKEYYKKFLALFIRHGILFENFILDEPGELAFAKESFLPAFFEVCDKIGVKPLIVALTPTEIEGEGFWLRYPGEMMEYVNKKASV